MAEIHAWARMAAKQLKDDEKPEEIERFSYAGYTTRYATMAEHWKAWRSKLNELGGEESRLSESAKRMARECYKWIP